MPGQLRFGVWALAAALAAVVRPAAGAEVTITFDDLPPNTLVTTQYENAGGAGAGVIFGTGPFGP